MDTIPKTGQIAARYGYNCAGFVSDLFVGCEFFKEIDAFPAQPNNVEEAMARWMDRGIQGRVVDIIDESAAGITQLVFAFSDGSTDAVRWNSNTPIWMKIPTE